MGHLHNFSCDVHQPSGYRRHPPEIQNPNKTGGRDSLKIRKSLQLIQRNWTPFIPRLASFHTNPGLIFFRFLSPTTSCCQSPRCYNLAFAYTIKSLFHLQGHISAQTVIKQQSRCISWMAASPIVSILPLLIAGDNDEGSRQPAQTQQTRGDTLPRIIKPHRHKFKNRNRIEREKERESRAQSQCLCLCTWQRIRRIFIFQFHSECADTVRTAVCGDMSLRGAS